MVENEEAALRAEIARLNKMVVALMNRAERAMSAQGSDFGLFQSTVILERQVQERTKALEAALQEKAAKAIENKRFEKEMDFGKIKVVDPVTKKK